MSVTTKKIETKDKAYGTIIAVLLAILGYFSPGLINTGVVKSANAVIDNYCSTPESKRLELRKALGNRIQINCEQK